MLRKYSLLPHSPRPTSLPVTAGHHVNQDSNVTPGFFFFFTTGNIKVVCSQYFLVSGGLIEVEEEKCENLR